MTTYSGTLVGADGTSLDMTITYHPWPVDPPPPPPPATGRRRAIWHQGWRGPALGSWPADVRDAVDTVCIDMCQSAQGGTGRLTDPPGTSSVDVRALVAAGKDVLVGIGGSGGAGITVITAGQVADVVGSVQSIASRFGTTGCIWDLESAAGAGWTTDAVTAASQQLISGGLRVAICSATYGGRLAAWGKVARALDNDLHSWQRMFYDFPQARTSALTKIVVDDFAAMRAYVSRDDQLSGAFMPTDPGDPNTSPVPVLAAAYSAGLAAHPGAGWAVYHDANDGPNGWAATRALAKL